MPAPSASFILSMLSPYQGFDPNNGARTGIAAGQLGEQRAARRQDAEQFSKTNARADAYFGLERERFGAGQLEKQREQQIDAFGKFNDAIVNGDEEQTQFWAQQLQGSGVQVEEYGGASSQKELPPVAGTAPGGAGNVARSAPSPMDAYAPPSAAGAAAGAIPQAPGSFPSEVGDSQYDPKTGNRLGKTPPRPGYSMEAMEAPGVRPGPARAEGPGQSAESPTESMMSPSDAAGSEQGIPGGMSEAEAAASPPGKGYRLRVAGKMIDIRPEDIRRRQEERVAGAMDALVKGASTPAEKRAAEAARAFAVKAIPTLGVKGAMKVGVEHYEQELEREGAERRARYAAAGRQVPGGFNKDDTLRQAGVDRSIGAHIQRFENTNELKQARATIDSGNKVLEMTESGNSVAEWAAQQSVLKEFVRGVASDRDLGGFLGSMGRTNQIMKEFNAWFEGGAMPEDINRKVAELAIAARGFAEKKLIRIGERAANSFERNRAITSRITPEEVQEHKRNIFYQITGREMPEPQQAQPRGGQPRQGGKPAPPAAGGSAAATDKQKRVDELRKKARR